MSPAPLDPAIGLDDFLVRRPGGIRRARDIGGIRESTQQWGGAQAFPMLEYLDSQAEGRTGVSKRSAGLSPDLLNPNVSATASLQMMSAVQARIELIARRFAEGFLNPLFLGILRDVARHQDEVRLVRLQGRFVPMDPRSWNVGMDVSVAVGLGTASQDRRLAMLGQVLSLQRAVMQAGGLGGMVTPALLRNTLEDLVRAGELSGVDRYFAPPGPPPPRRPIRGSRSCRRRCSCARRSCRGGCRWSSRRRRPRRSGTWGASRPRSRSTAGGRSRSWR